MPRLWNETVESHRQSVREAIFRAVHAQVRERGLAGVTMSGIAAEAGIGRATLYKYFPDVQAILDAMHERHIGEHLAGLSRLASGDSPVADRLRAVLTEYAEARAVRARDGDAEVVALVHRPEAMGGADQRLLLLFTELLAEAKRAKVVRTDMPAQTLAAFCLQALSGAESAGSTAVEGGTLPEVVELTLDGLRGSR